MLQPVHVPDWSRHLGHSHRHEGMRGTRLGVASAERDVTGSLSLVTKEGDTVTLSASFDSTVTYAGLRRRGHGEGGAWTASSHTQSSVSLQVQGELSADELADIRQVVERFMSDLRGLMRGRDESIADVVEVDATTLASISATATTEQTLTLISAGGRRLAPPAPAPFATGPDGVRETPAHPATPTSEDADLAAGSALASSAASASAAATLSLLTSSDTNVTARG